MNEIKATFSLPLAVYSDMKRAAQMKRWTLSEYATDAIRAAVERDKAEEEAQDADSKPAA